MLYHGRRVGVVQKEEFENRAILNRRRRLHARSEQISNGDGKTKVDVGFLAKQVEEKRVRELEERERDRQLARAIQSRIAVVDISEGEARVLAREKAKEIDAYRREFQKREKRRDFDLDDPDHLRKCTVPVLHEFHGDDLEMRQRKVRQREQMRRWCDAKLEEKKLREGREKEEDLKRHVEQQRFLQVIGEVEVEQAAKKRKLQRDVAEFNLHLARIRKLNEEKQRKKDYLEKVRHVKNTMNSNLMSENRESTFSNFRGGRYIPANYKGISKEQNLSYIQANKKLVEEKKKHEAEEREKEQRLERERIRNSRFLDIQERKFARMRRQRQRATFDRNVNYRKY